MTFLLYQSYVIGGSYGAVNRMELTLAATLTPPSDHVELNDAYSHHHLTLMLALKALAHVVHLCIVCAGLSVLFCKSSAQR